MNRDLAKMCLTAIISLLAVVICCLVCASCRSVKYVPVETKVLLKDSVVTRDSLVIKEKTVQKDSIIYKDSTVLIVDEEGNVIRTELYRYRDSYKELSRDYSSLQAKYDSLLSIKQKEVQIPYPVEKELTRWQSFKVELGGWAFGIIISFALIIVGWLVYRLRRK